MQFAKKVHKPKCKLLTYMTDFPCVCVSVEMKIKLQPTLTEINIVIYQLEHGFLSAKKSANLVAIL